MLPVPPGLIEGVRSAALVGEDVVTRWVQAEDLSRVRDHNAAANLAVLRRIALNLVRAHPSPGTLKAKRKRAAWDDASMQKIISASVHA